MEIAKTYSPSETESKWYAYWMEKKFFRSVPDKREPYTIVIPPPNVTGVLHMGHMLNNTLQDVLIRKARMQGKNACWVPGTDHASIATEAKVVGMLREKGIKKSDLSRDEFLKYAWEWKEKYGGIILEQLKKLGASCDWDRTRFTMDEAYYKDVINVFIDLYNKGFIYRGLRMVNWDPVAKTAVSDEEVIFKQVNSKLVYVKYYLENSKDFLVVATVRPETIMGDVAVAVHPEDDRFKKFHGKKVMVPLVGRAIPVITDESVDREFGTGCLKITPAHDKTDFEIGKRHKLPSIDILNEDGTIAEAAKVFVGLERVVARKKALQQLQEDGLIEKIEDYSHQVGHSERTSAVIEPRLSMQWFLDMKKISAPALKAVLDGEVKLIPDKFVNTYRHWMENVHDWCLSRQLWWGHRIPAWYDKKGEFVVAPTAKEALDKFKEKDPSIKSEDIRQDEDVLDTWASSWLWPISVFDGYEKPDGEIKYYYPTNDLVTAPEILFFWVARMIIAGYEYKKAKPFQNVYLTGIVRDKQGRKMSKSLGNSPDPLDLISKYGADGVRVGMLLCSPAGNDLLFDEKYCEQGRNFTNKIWNAFRLIQGWESSNDPQSEKNKLACEWFQSKLNEQIVSINNSYNKYKISEALMSTYILAWSEFCSKFLELIKPPYSEGKQVPIDKTTLEQTILFLEDILKLLHPFTPFLTEEIWDKIRSRDDSTRIINAKWPTPSTINERILVAANLIFECAEAIKKEKSKNGLKNNTTTKIVFDGFNQLGNYLELAKAATGATDIIEKSTTNETLFFVTSGTTELNDINPRLEYSLYFFFPNSNLSSSKSELEEELKYQLGFLHAVQKKLANERFVQNAKPEVIEMERKKQSDAEAKIKAIEAQLAALR